MEDVIGILLLVVLCCFPLAPITGLIVSALFLRRSIAFGQLFKHSFDGGLIFSILAAILGFLMSFAIFGVEEFTKECTSYCVDQWGPAIGYTLITVVFCFIGMIIGGIVACKCYLKTLNREPFHRKLLYKQLFYRRLFQVFLLPFLLVFILDILRLLGRI
jgi:amino acid transporter